MNEEIAIRYLSANDIYAYIKIAQSFPHFPSDSLAFHHAQRFTLPYLVGAIADITHLSVFRCFSLVSYGLIVGIIITLLSFLEKQSLNLKTTVFFTGLLLLNPYSFRYYLLAGGMVTDLGFVLGITLISLGLLNTQYGTVFLGIVLGILSRQTLVLALPILTLWVILDKSLRNSQKYLIVLAINLITLILYFWTGYIAGLFAEKSQNIKSLTGIFVWLSSNFDFKVLLEQGLRLFIPYSLMVAVLFRKFHQFSTDLFQEITRNKELILFPLMTLLIISQPLLAGPEITGQNASRLSALGLIPLWITLVRVCHYFPQCQLKTISGQRFFLLSFVVIVASFHHLYTVIGEANAILFSGVQLISAMFVYWLV